MKTTGIVRKIDELGRVVLPIEMRKTLNLQIRDEVEIQIKYAGYLTRQENRDQKIRAGKGQPLCLLRVAGKSAAV